MWSYVVRRILYNIPIFVVIIVVVMAMLRINDPTFAYLGKNPTPEQIEAKRVELGVDQPFFVQVWDFFASGFGLGERSWYAESRTVDAVVLPAILPSLAITLPALALSTTLGVCIGLISAANRGRVLDRALVFLAVIGMSISFLVFIIIGQYFGAYRLSEWLGVEVFAVRGFDLGVGDDVESPNVLQHIAAAFGGWAHYCLLPVLISVVVTLGYDTRFYRSVIVEQSTSDYIRTARAKGASETRVMVKHLLRNALIPIITRVMITLPFVVVGSLLLEIYFSVPGMGQTLLTHMTNKDFPVTQTIVALLAAIFILSNILTDVLYAIVDPRVRLK
ncbi:MAG: ABC transporter permease [Planctomycetota bacterium]